MSIRFQCQQICDGVGCDEARDYFGNTELEVYYEATEAGWYITSHEALCPTCYEQRILFFSSQDTGHEQAGE